MTEAHARLPRLPDDPVQPEVETPVAFLAAVGTPGAEGEDGPALDSAPSPAELQEKGFVIGGCPAAYLVALRWDSVWGLRNRECMYW